MDELYEKVSELGFPGVAGALKRRGLEIEYVAGGDPAKVKIKGLSLLSLEVLEALYQEEACEESMTFDGLTFYRVNKRYQNVYYAYYYQSQETVLSGVAVTLYLLPPFDRFQHYRGWLVEIAYQGKFYAPLQQACNQAIEAVRKSKKAFSPFVQGYLDQQAL